MEYILIWIILMYLIVKNWGSIQGTADFAGILSIGLLIGTLLTLGYFI